MRLSGQRDIVGEPSASGDERLILAADGGSVAAEARAGSRFGVVGAPNAQIHASPDLPLAALWQPPVYL
jgi:hypothetical protein